MSLNPLSNSKEQNTNTSSTKKYVTESCWGSIWTRPGLELKTRSLLNIAMLCALNRSTELGVHCRGALSNGASEVEIREVILQAACYCEFHLIICFLVSGCLDLSLGFGFGCLSRAERSRMGERNVC